MPVGHFQTPVPLAPHCDSGGGVTNVNSMSGYSHQVTRSQNLPTLRWESARLLACRTLAFPNPRLRSPSDQSPRLANLYRLIASRQTQKSPLMYPMITAETLRCQLSGLCGKEGPMRYAQTKIGRTHPSGRFLYLALYSALRPKGPVTAPFRGFSGF